MNASATPFENLVNHAHGTRVVVVGGGIAGLVAALECAKVGMRVTLLEASGRLGGVVQTVQVDGLEVDTATQGFPARSDELLALVDDLGLRSRVQGADADATWLSGLASGPVPLPGGGVVGIPENPWDERVRRVIGWRGSWRAYLDRLRPPLTIGQERSLGRLVRRRMGVRVLDRLVAPLSLGDFSIHPDDVDVDVAAPGLGGALTRTGSLAGGVAQVRAARSPTSGPSFLGFDGGMTVLVQALRGRLDDLGADIRLGERATAISRSGDGAWVVEADAAASAEAATLADSSVGSALDDGSAATRSGRVAADVVIVATSEADARKLLRAQLPAIGSESDGAVELEVVNLVIASAAVTAAPRRTAVYPIPGTARASALSDLTARWPSLRRAAGRDVHVLRLTFGAPGTAPATAGLDDAEAVAVAMAEASALLNVPLDIASARAFHRQRYWQPRPVSALGQSSSAAAVRRAVAAVPGLAAVGAWLSGTGLAQVVPDAAAEAERVRRAELWGEQNVGRDPDPH